MKEKERLRKKKVAGSGSRCFGRQRQADWWEFKNILVYTVSSRATQRDPVSKNKANNKKRKMTSDS